MKNASLITLVLGLAMVSVVGCADREGRVGGVDRTTVRGSDGERLTLVKPRNISIERGEAESIAVDLERNNLNGQVKITISQLPDGVEAVDTPRVTNGTHVELVLQAKPGAALVRNHQALVTAEGPDGIRATETLEISIEEQS